MTEAMTYKSRTLARKGKTIWYGDNSKPFVMMMQLDGAQETGDVSAATTVRCFLMRTDTTDLKDRIKKQAVCNSLYEAMELADAWLKTYNL